MLTLDAALGDCAAGIVRHAEAIIERRHGAGRGAAAALPGLARSVLTQAGLHSGGLAGVAVTVGPGSFTGIRAALALAHGIGLGTGLTVIGVGLGDAFRVAAATDRPVWVAIDSRRGRVFLDDGAGPRTMTLDALPAPPGPVALAGDAAAAVAGAWRALGHDVEVLGERPTAVGIARAAILLPRPAQPLYVDAPEARPRPGRPAPHG